MPGHAALPVCTVQGCLCAVPPGAVGFGGAASAVYSPGSPPPGGGGVVFASATLPVVNPMGVDALGFFVFSLQANKNLHGSVSTDVQLLAQFDAGGFTAIVQDLHNLTGAHGSNAAVGGDGSVLAGGRNGMHLDMTSSQSRVSGDVSGIIPALITAGAHTLDIELEIGFSGLWDDPANPNDNFAFWVGLASWVLVPA